MSNVDISADASVSAPISHTRSFYTGTGHALLRWTAIKLSRDPGAPPPHSIGDGSVVSTIN